LELKWHRLQRFLHAQYLTNHPKLILMQLGIDLNGIELRGSPTWNHLLLTQVDSIYILKIVFSIAFLLPAAFLLI
jgi:hypothetical protein